MKTILDHKISQYTIAIIMVLGSLLCVFTPDFELIQKGAEFTVHYMLALLVLSLFFMVFDQKRLMIAAAACCMILALFLKDASNSSLKFPVRSAQPNISVAHVNVSNVETSYEALAQVIIDKSPDIISLQEITPDWDLALSDLLQQAYPYKHAMVRIDYYGMSIFSKNPLNLIDTIYFQDIPNLKVTVSFDKQQISLISSYMLPPLYNQLDQKRKEHFRVLTEHANATRTPLISLGDFNITSWSSELRNYKNAANLDNSQRDITESGLRIPHDHIFYTTDMECTSFSEITDSDLRHLGIMGSYQFKPEDPDRSEYTNKINLF